MGAMTMRFLAVVADASATSLYEWWREEMSHSWVLGLQVRDIKKRVYCPVLFSIIAQLISRSLNDMISNTV